MIRIRNADPGVPPVEGEGFAQLLRDGEGDAGSLAPPLGPGAEIQSLPHPGMNRDRERTEGLAAIERVGGELVGVAEMLQKALQKLVQGRSSGMVDGVGQWLKTMMFLDPAGHHHIAVALTLPQGPERLGVGPADPFGKRLRRGVLEQVPDVEVQPSSGHAEEVVIRPQGRLRLQVLQLLVGVPGVGDPGMAAFVMKIGKQDCPCTPTQQSTQGVTVQADAVAVTGLDAVHHQHVGVRQLIVQARNILGTGNVHGGAGGNPGVRQGLPQSEHQGIGLAVAHHQHAQLIRSIGDLPAQQRRTHRRRPGDGVSMKLLEPVEKLDAPADPGFRSGMPLMDQGINPDGAESAALLFMDGNPAGLRRGMELEGVKQSCSGEGVEDSGSPVGFPQIHHAGVARQGVAANQFDSPLPEEDLRQPGKQKPSLIGERGAGLRNQGEKLGDDSAQK